MSRSTFETPAPIAVVLDLYVAQVRFAASDRTDTVVEVRPSDPDKPADVRAAENTRVEYDETTRTLGVVTRKPLNRFVNFSSRRPESVDVLIQLPAGSDVRGEADLGDFDAEGALGTVQLKNDVGAVHLAATGSVNLRNGVGRVVVDQVNGNAQIHTGSSDISVGSVDGTADVTNGNGRIQIGLLAGPAGVRGSNGSVHVERAFADITAASANGEVRIGEVVRGKVSATTKNGSVHVGVRHGSAALLDLHTTVGRVHNALAAAAAPDAAAAGTAAATADRLDIHAETKLGDVTIHRTPALKEQV
ncbi:DUF4097 family beta strand repeat-containing protein [Streptacidiphilus anmyonensis]|uniref:DUF4097 family beta strand repeat-containing protein n=1 Tax=Streptacidiphilus anmyonensis TaxID=405782 RepID=UPI0005A7FFC8|nr:DUF4097 family beta strand repeat-containing protein [Streptacidiphilus anmyonensis]